MVHVHNTILLLENISNNPSYSRFFTRKMYFIFFFLGKKAENLCLNYTLFLLVVQISLTEVRNIIIKGLLRRGGKRWAAATLHLWQGLANIPENNSHLSYNEVAVWLGSCGININMGRTPMEWTRKHTSQVGAKGKMGCIDILETWKFPTFHGVLLIKEVTITQWLNFTLPCYRVGLY